MHAKEKRNQPFLVSPLFNSLLFLPSLVTIFFWIVFITQHNLIFENEHAKKTSFENLFVASPGEKKTHEVVSPDGHRITVYEFTGKKEDVDILFLHGSTMHPKVHCKNLRRLSDETKCNVLTFCYRGFDGTDAIPTENNLMMDVFSVKKFLDTRSTKTRVIFGQSLGCALALYFSTLLSESALLILENPFFNGRSFVKKRLPWYFQPLIVAKYPNDKRIRSLSKDVQVLFLLAEHENVINEMDSWNLRSLLKKSAVQVVPGSNHLTMGVYDAYYAMTNDFIETSSKLKAKEENAIFLF